MRFINILILLFVTFLLYFVFPKEVILRLCNSVIIISIFLLFFCEDKHSFLNKNILETKFQMKVMKDIFDNSLF